MAKKKPVAKRSHHKKATLPLPSLDGCPFPEEIILVPIPVHVDDIKPLPLLIGPTRCVATKIIGWSEDYIVLSAKNGMLPEISEKGTECDVVFSPPSSGKPPYPHD